MNRTRTPVQSHKTKQVPECEDVDQEFCKRALSLLTSLYETPTADEIISFPPSSKVDLPPPDKKLNFNSNIVDLRLRRAQDQQIKAIDDLNSLLASRVDDMSKDLKESNINLDDVFMADKVNMKKIQTEYRERLEKSKERGTERLHRRINRITNSGPQIPENTYHSNRVDDLDPRKREIERRKILKERKDKRLHFMSQNDYKKFVKPKKTVKTSEDEDNLEYEEYLI